MRRDVVYVWVIEVLGYYYVWFFVGSYGIDVMNRVVYKIGNNMCIFGLISEWW